MLLPPDDILKKMSLMDEKWITRAALLLFGKDPARFIANHFELK